MSKAVRKQLFKTLDLLSSAGKLLKNIIAEKKTQEAIQLLTESQECAITIGNLIEAVYGEGLGCVHSLENLCEIIFQLSNQLGVTNSTVSLYQKYQEEITQIRQKIEVDIPNRLEVVFLPYKASMWDSLESVWMSARDDKDCDDYVIPIPYYDKNPDGSFREEHWEGNEYPNYVPITRYDEYNFELRKPDIIYIHNPYDEGNYVTSVHPFFYSKNLKQFTEKLVYIPYFVLDEVDPNNKEALKTIEHFCLTSGIINADEVIVQSEAMKQAYVNILTEYMGESKENRAYWEKKVLGLGSPKFDKVANTKKEDLYIPKDWLKVIEKPDGSWKKIILYNTGISALLKYDEKMLNKIQNVFKIFKERKDDVALLWRPHPLIQATIESMRPQLWEGYKEIVEKYRMEGWGIYDDSSDVDRAVTLCDGYYGDASSVVQLCKKTEKRIMIQNSNVYKTAQ